MYYLADHGLPHLMGPKPEIGKRSSPERTGFLGMSKGSTENTFVEHEEISTRRNNTLKLREEME